MLRHDGDRRAAILKKGMHRSSDKGGEQESKQGSDEAPEQQSRRQDQQSDWGEDTVHCRFPDTCVAF